MIGIMLGLALQSATPEPPINAPVGPLRGLISAFDSVCNQGFPDDERVASAMSRVPTMKPLTLDQLRIYLKDDPGRGWITDDGSIVITIESPPFHACAVRMLKTAGAIDEVMWRAVINAAEVRAGGGFTPMPPQGFVIGDSRTTAVGDQKINPDGSAEAFYLMRTAPVDQAKAKIHGVELRLVRQIVSAGAR